VGRDAAGQTAQRGRIGGAGGRGMTYLDTGSLVKLYYPEPDSAKVVALVQGKQLCHTRLHELEIVNALQLKVFSNSATASQVTAARALVEADLKAGVLVSPTSEWEDILAEAVKLAEQHTGTIGCRSLDILHCAAAKVVGATEFMTTDSRQKKLAAAMGLSLVTF
jgi:predicted nucleic acid-binding protein